MGAYLSAPVTEKEAFEGGEEGGLVFGGSAMQGWRRTMEDAHTAVLRVGNADLALFGVFDGHGGAEVAKFCSKHMPAELQRLPQFQGASGPHVADGLVQLFHRMDEMLRHEDFQPELEAYKGKRSDDEEESGEEEASEGGSPGGSMSPNEAIDVLKKLIAWRRVMNEGNGAAPGAGPAAAAVAEGEASTACGVEQEVFLEDDMQEDNLPEHSIQAGCTAVVAVLVEKKHLYVANAGDSRAVLSRAGKAVALSEDHKPAQDRERNRIVAAGGFLSDIGGVCRVNGNLNLSRAIGDLKYKANDALPPSDQIITAQPDVQYLELGADDQFLVLACDGVWDVMENQEVVDFVLERLSRGLAPKSIACELLDACLANNPKDAKGIGCDNMTAQIILMPQGSMQFGVRLTMGGAGDVHAQQERQQAALA